MVDIRWIWLFLDTVETDRGPSWEFWRQVTRSALSPTRGERDQFATFLPAHGDPWIKVQAVQTVPVGRTGGVHLDLDVDDPRVAAEEAKGLGAREVGTFTDPDPDGGPDRETVVVMTTPAGQLFCFTTHRGEQRHQHREDEPDLLDQVCLDLAEEDFAVDAVFWHDLTGWDLGAGGAHREFRSLRRPTGIPVRLLVQRLGATTSPPGAHVDLACLDRAATRRHHEGLGATHVGDGPRWSVMRDPVGRIYCLTDRDVVTGTLAPDPVNP